MLRHRRCGRECASILTQGLVEQPARLDPIAPHGTHGDTERLGGLLFAHATEEAAFHDACESGVELRELIERVVQLEERFRFRIDGGEILVEGDVPMWAATFLGFSPARVVDENVAHRDGCCTEEVRTILPIGASGAGELEVELVNESSRRQRIAGASKELVARGTPQLVVHERQYLVERLSTSGTKISEQLGDSIGVARRRESSERRSCIPHG